jgi:glycosyltransferase involved in cell wall biosynthesis
MEYIKKHKRVLLFGVTQDSISNFRMGLILLLKNHYCIHVVVSNPSENFIKEMNLLNITVHSLDLQRRSYNILNIIKNYKNYKKIINLSKPDLIIAYTIKPILISSFLRTIYKQSKLIVMFEGLGTMFDNSNQMKIFIKNIIILIYRFLIPSSDAVIFLNQEDKNYFEKLKIINPHKSFLINGIGINLNHYYYNPVKDINNIKFLLIARLIKEKGVYDFIDAAKIVKNQYPNVEFNLIGQIEAGGLSIDEIKKFENEGIINYLGVLNDIRPAIIECSAFILPTFYNEGLPRTILEAMSIGRTIISTNIKGCNQTIVEGENGFYVNVNDPVMLSKILIRLINNPQLFIIMGKNSRLISEKKFSEKVINDYIFNNIILPLLKDE